MTRVTLLTDFGTSDGYAAAMAGVIAAAAPGAAIDHATHDIPQGDIAAAALALVRYADRYPPGTVHLIVVDPGVGTGRRPIAATLDGRHYVAPDNGVLTLVLERAAGAGRDTRIVEITDPGLVDDASATFHGRDIFAPAAARLARGDALDSLGPEIDDPIRRPWPEPTPIPAARAGGQRRAGVGGVGGTGGVDGIDGVEGVVVQVDRFGNLITNVPEALAAGATRVTVSAGARTVEPPGPGGDGPAGDAGDAAADVEVGALRRTYGDVEPGELVALIGSLGLLEVSVRDGSAADRLGAGRGANVRVETRRAG